MGVLYDPTKEDRRARGYMAKLNGKRLEALVDAACDMYRAEGIADIEKTPEPMRPIQTTEAMRRQGRFVAVYEKRAQPDYKGVIMGGRCIMFDAKYTDADRIQLNAVSDAQRERMDNIIKMGGRAGILVSFAFHAFYFIPWTVFRDMKTRYGRQYMLETECEEYRIKHAAGVPLFIPSSKAGIWPEAELLKPRTKHGEWVPGTETSPCMPETDACSECGYRTVYGHGFNFCPGCGADMRQKAKGEENEKSAADHS